MSMRTQDDWLAYSTDHDLLLAGKASNTFALNAKSGKEVWHQPIRGQQPLILGPESFINQNGHTYQVATGKLPQRISSVSPQRLQLRGWWKKPTLPAIQLRDLRRCQHAAGICHSQFAIRLQQQLCCRGRLAECAVLFRRLRLQLSNSNVLCHVSHAAIRCLVWKQPLEAIIRILI